MKQWDVFISHASEDTKTVAQPLAEALRPLGIDVWLDRSELRIGDSLMEKIDEGLANSFYGVLVVSPSFIAKAWPRRELNGLMAKEELGRKVVLPVWHNVTKEQLLTYSPILADRLASNTMLGIDTVASEIASVVLDPRHPTMPPERRGVASRFARLLNSGASAATLKQLLRAFPKLTLAAFYVVDSERSVIEWDVTFGPHHVDLAIGQIWGSYGGDWSWTFVNLLEQTDVENTRTIEEVLNEFNALRLWLTEHTHDADKVLPGIPKAFSGWVVVGRRDGLTDEQRQLRGLYNKDPHVVQVHTYDTLSELATAAGV